MYDDDGKETIIFVVYAKIFSLEIEETEANQSRSKKLSDLRAHSHEHDSIKKHFWTSLMHHKICFVGFSSSEVVLRIKDVEERICCKLNDMKDNNKILYGIVNLLSLYLLKSSQDTKHEQSLNCTTLCRFFGLTTSKI